MVNLGPRPPPETLTDIDFWPSVGLRERIMHPSMATALADPLGAVVVPAFSRDKWRNEFNNKYLSLNPTTSSTTGTPKSSSSSSVHAAVGVRLGEGQLDPETYYDDYMPTNLTFLRQCIQVGRCSRFDIASNPLGHSSTGSTKEWMERSVASMEAGAEAEAEAGAGAEAEGGASAEILEAQRRAIERITCFRSNRYEPFVVIRSGLARLHVERRPERQLNQPSAIQHVAHGVGSEVGSGASSAYAVYGGGGAVAQPEIESEEWGWGCPSGGPSLRCAVPLPPLFDPRFRGYGKNKVNL